MKTTRWFAALALVAVVGSASTFADDGRGPGSSDLQKLDRELRHRAEHQIPGRTQVIVEFRPGWDATNDLRNLGVRLGRRLRSYNGQVIELPNGQLKQLARIPAVASVHYDRPIGGSNFTTGLTIGAATVRKEYGYTGAGVGVAVVDSGISSWHDDMTGAATLYGDQRISKFVDLVNGNTQPYDDFGHGTHVSGIIAGNGYDSMGLRAGVAPDARIVSLKVLDGNGLGTISNIIAALDYVAAHKSEFNIRVVNLSVSARVTESYETDPLTLAAKKTTQSGIVVVAAAGNFGKAKNGGPLYGAITAPGNAPWVLTVGASTTMGTPARRDDQIASFSSRGPTPVDYLAKPDLVAPGENIVSLSDPTSLFYRTKTSALVDGPRPTAYKPYITLSGTSMAAPAVSGTVALMLQANPNLTPNAVKAILEYTAQVYPDYDALTEGAGFLDTAGAVRLARFFKNAKAGDLYPVSKTWSRQILWGNHRVTGGYLTPTANAWANSVVWGSDLLGNDNVVWGSICPTILCDNIVWGSFTFDNVVWGSNLLDNVVWGSDLLGLFDNIVWGSLCGGADCDNVVWGSNLLDLDNIVWGSNLLTLDNIVWGSALVDLDNVVWGSDINWDNVVWGSNADIAGTNTDGADLLVSEADIAEALAFDSEPLSTPGESSQPAVSDPAVAVEGGL